jgi:hypothetical protein
MLIDEALQEQRSSSVPAKARAALRVPDIDPSESHQPGNKTAT